MTKRVIRVGVDVALRACGLAISIDKGFDEDEVLYASHFGFSKDDEKFPREGDRYRAIFDEIQRRLGVLGCIVPEYDEIYVVFEHYPMAGKGRICTMAELAGYLKARLECHFELHRVKARFFQLPPKSLKKFVTNYGSASKPQMLSHCESRFRKKFHDDNECDAYCATQALRHLQLCIGTRSELTRLAKVIREF